MGRSPSPNERRKRHKDNKRRREERDGSPPPRERDDAAPRTSDAGGEVAMSIEETNKMRIALGLKPLNMEAPKTSSIPKEVQEARAKKAAEEEEARTKQVADKIATARQRRMQQEKLRSTKTLGEADGYEEEEDLMAWVAKSRVLEDKAKAEARAKALELERSLAEQEEEQDGEDGDAGGVPLAAGMKVKGAVEEIMEGETLVMTLEDAPILDEKMQLNEGDDVLVNAAMREQFQRDKARRAATKTGKPLFGEDGKKQALLDKYDEEGDEEAMEIDASGGVDVEKRKRQEEIKAKLAAAGTGSLQTAHVEQQAAAEFYTAEEAAALFKPKKKKKKKVLRKRDADNELDLDALEEAAAAEAGNDLGSRSARGNRLQQDAAVLAEESKARRAKFDQVLQQANYASLALKTDPSTPGDDEGLDDELYESLARAKKAAAKKGTGTSEAMLAEVTRKRRAEQEALERQQAAQASQGLALNDMAEFVRQVTVAEEAADEPPPTKSKLPPPPAPPPQAPPTEDTDMPDAPPVASGWVAAEEDGGAQGGGGIGGDVGGEEGAGPSAAGGEEERGEEGGGGVVGGADGLLTAGAPTVKAMGMGLGGILDSLRQRGELKGGINDMVWGGRASDRAKSKLTVLEEVFTGSDDKLVQDVETALTRRDEFGRVLTPKEAYRQLCYAFHGVKPSKNTKDKRLRKIMQEIERQKQATSDSKAATSIDAMKKVQEVTNTPYIVLSGKLKPAQISDPASEYAIEKDSKDLLGGSSSPLLGTDKVKVMLHLDKNKGKGKK